MLKLEFLVDQGGSKTSSNNITWELVKMPNFSSHPDGSTESESAV